MTWITSTMTFYNPSGNQAIRPSKASMYSQIKQMDTMALEMGTKAEIELEMITLAMTREHLAKTHSALTRQIREKRMKSQRHNLLFKPCNNRSITPLPLLPIKWALSNNKMEPNYELRSIKVGLEPLQIYLDPSKQQSRQSWKWPAQRLCSGIGSPTIVSSG